MTRKNDELHNPPYPELGSALAKHRKLARDGLATLSASERHDYGAAVEKAIRAKQRSELQRELPTHRVSCASGTDHNTGEAIHKAILAQHRARTQAWPAQIRKARTDAQWREMYAQAMQEKRNQSIAIKQAA
jgi:hypothetical protein